MGPRGTGKSYFFSEFSPYSTLISGGQATKAMLFYNNARHKIGLVGFWDTVAFDEVGGIKVKDPDTIQIMKDYMANGRFSRGVEVIADASMAFVGNIDMSVEQIVNSTEYDLFQPLPRAVRPGGDGPLRLLPSRLGDAEEQQRVSDRATTASSPTILPRPSTTSSSTRNRYEEVSKRVRLGRAVEGRDEKGIKKTLCAFLKILHPSGCSDGRGVRRVCGLRGRMPPPRQGADEQAEAGRRVRPDQLVLLRQERQRGRRQLPRKRGRLRDARARAATAPDEGRGGWRPLQRRRSHAPGGETSRRPTA